MKFPFHIYKKKLFCISSQNDLKVSQNKKSKIPLLD